ESNVLIAANSQGTIKEVNSLFHMLLLHDILPYHSPRAKNRKVGETGRSHPLNAQNKRILLDGYIPLKLEQMETRI
ncbi:hypothetical protein STEG23_015522, partial [Scotinomys teguina]